MDKGGRNTGNKDGGADGGGDDRDLCGDRRGGMVHGNLGIGTFGAVVYTDEHSGVTRGKGGKGMKKIAITAGHYKGTAGRRCLKALDKNETKEWELNSRIAERIEEHLKSYEGYELLRTDDRRGEKYISVEERTRLANKFGADIYISIHHNAGIHGGIGGGIEAYIYKGASKESRAWQEALYASLVEATGLRGNRAEPLRASSLAECRLTAMPAVLLELGYMDSRSDVPIILGEKFASDSARAIGEVIAERLCLEKRGKLYRVQVGAYRERENAEAMVKALKEKGFEGIIRE